MYEFLKKLFGETADKQPEALTYEQLEKKITESKDLKLVNLSDGGYVAKDKFDSKDTELAGIKKQLETANTEIKSYKDMDIEGIKKSAQEYEENAKKEIESLQTQLKSQQLDFAEEKFFSQYKFSSDFAKAGVKSEFHSKGFKFDEKSGSFLGAEEYMKGIMESQKAAFVIDEPPAGDDGNNGNNGAGGDAGNGAGGDTGKKPTFLGGAGTQGAPSGAGATNPFGFSFTGVRPNPNQQK